MSFNAYILDWSMDNYAQLRQKLAKANFTFKQEEKSEHIRVAVPLRRVNEFASLCQAPGHRRASICQYLRSEAIGLLHLTYESQGGCAVEVICSGAQYRQNSHLWIGSLESLALETSAPGSA